MTSVCLHVSHTRRIVRSIAAVLVMLKAIHASAQPEESALECHQRAINNVGKYAENMNNRWFATTVTRKYYADDGAPYVQEREAVVYYSKSLLYINSQEWFTSDTSTRNPEEHIELIATDAWTITVDHNPIGRNAVAIKIAEGGTPAALQLANSVRAGNDIISWFDSRLKRTTMHEYAEPRLDEQSRLVVRLDRSSYVNDSDIERMRQYPILELAFSGDSDVRPISLRSFLLNDKERLVQTGNADIRYRLNDDRKLILQSIRSETGFVDKPKEFYNIQVRETSRPEWCESPPRISVSTGQLEVQRYSDSGAPTERRSGLPAETARFIQRYDEVELQERLRLQQETLKTVRDFVMAIPIDAPEPSLVAGVTPTDRETQASNIVPLVLGCLAICIFVCWLSVWFRWHSRKL